MSKENYIYLTETYVSIQGEGDYSGELCFFIRTSGCDLRCSWCDTPESFDEGYGISKEELLSLIPEDVKNVQITGGEPLLQAQSVIDLIRTLSESPYNKRVLLETGGHHSIQGIPSVCHICMDVKLPSSGESEHDFLRNFPFLKLSDEIKFVIADRQDYDQAVSIVLDHDLIDRCHIFFSPAFEILDGKKLADWIIRDQLSVRMQLQLHKYIWGGDAKGV